jgi:hypothetical protein
MSAYSDNQEIEDLIVDVSISLEEADKASLVMRTCQTGLQKNMDKLKYLISELEDKDLAAKYAKQISDMLLASLINQTQVELKYLMGQRDE